jgi:hypothetical protein
VKLTDDEYWELSFTEDYEMLWMAGAALRYRTPSSSDEELKQRGHRAIMSLFDKGLIALYRSNYWGPGTIFEIISTDKAKEALADPANWQAPAEDNAAFYCYASTDEGWKAYEENGRERYDMHQRARE